MGLLSVVVLAAVFGMQTGEPRLFAPGVVSTGDEEFAPTFEPDGKTVYFTKSSPGRLRVMWIAVSRLRDGKWSTPEIAPFSGRYTDIDPYVTPDGKRLFFASNRPTSGTAPRRDFDLWVMERTASGWGEPKHLGAPVNSDGVETTTAVAPDGTLYFASDNRPDGLKGRFLYRAKYVDGRYTDVEQLPASINAGASASNQYIAPDGSYMIFASNRPNEPSGGGLYITYNRDGAWSEPESLGAVFSEYDAFTPVVSPDGKHLYFTSRRGAFDTLPVERMPYEKFVETMRAPGNGLGDIYYIEFRHQSRSR